jgi:large subunit ribosomal protein L6
MWAEKFSAKCFEDLNRLRNLRSGDKKVDRMSRIGRKPVALPQGVTAAIRDGTVSVKGSKGELQVALVPEVAANLDEAGINVVPRKNDLRSRAMWGMQRTLVSNLVDGVTKGFSRQLEISGVGYRAAVQGKTLQLQLGFSHDVNYPIPEGITIVAERPTSLTISGSDKQLVGQVASEIRNIRPPEPYKGKGVKYAEERVRRKEGKKK